jgi:hypothetical protein
MSLIPWLVKKLFKAGHQLFSQQAGPDHQPIGLAGSTEHRKWKSEARAFSELDEL